MESYGLCGFEPLSFARRRMGLVATMETGDGKKTEPALEQEDRPTGPYIEALVNPS